MFNLLIWIWRCEIARFWLFSLKVSVRLSKKKTTSCLLNILKQIIFGFSLKSKSFIEIIILKSLLWYCTVIISIIVLRISFKGHSHGINIIINIIEWGQLLSLFSIKTKTNIYSLWTNQWMPFMHGIFFFYQFITQILFLRKYLTILSKHDF